MLFPTKRIAGFFLRLLLVYGLLIAIWPVLQGTYLASFRAVGNVVFKPLGRKVGVTFLPLSQADKKMDTKVHLENRSTGFMWVSPLNARLMGYTPTAEVLALILATPLPWSRKWKALLYGCILANGLAVFRVSILVLYGFGGAHKAALFSPGPFWGAVLDASHEVIAASFAFAFAAPIVVWILATFRRGDLDRILQESAP